VLIMMTMAASLLMIITGMMNLMTDDDISFVVHFCNQLPVFVFTVQCMTQFIGHGHPFVERPA